MLSDQELRKQQKYERKLAAHRKAQRDEFVRASFNTEQGREYFWWLLSVCKIGVNPFSSNALNMSFACGELNIGLQVQAHLVEAAPDGYLHMMKEREDGRSTDNGNADDDSGDDAARTFGYDAAS